MLNYCATRNGSKTRHIITHKLYTSSIRYRSLSLMCTTFIRTIQTKYFPIVRVSFIKHFLLKFRICKLELYEFIFISIDIIFKYVWFFILGSFTVQLHYKIEKCFLKEHEDMLKYNIISSELPKISISVSLSS